MGGPLNSYNSLIERQEIGRDSAQEEVVAQLEALHTATKGYRPGKRGLFGRKRAAPRGLYIHGSVGRGKSLIMDLFFDSAQIKPKRRVHFHEFMQEIHQWIFEWRQMTVEERQKSRFFIKDAGEDPIRPAAIAVARNAALLCFDEFYVSDIADAMILGRLFEALLNEGVILVATSNSDTNDLYTDGINRELFVPVIEMLNSRLDVLNLTGDRDYRLERLSGAPVYYSPLGRASDAAMNDAWGLLTCHAKPVKEFLIVKGRKLTAPRVAHGAARFSYQDLITKPLGPADYLAIAQNYHTVFIDRVRKLGSDKRNEARRFMTMIDAFYEHRVNLVMSAETPPEGIHSTGFGSKEFSRTVSRLVEMQGEDYLAKPHRILSAESPAVS